MSDRVISIKSDSCNKDQDQVLDQNQDQCLVIFNDNGQKNGDTKLGKNQKITFVNGLKPTAELKFYEQLSGEVSTNPITDFCKDVPSNPLQVKDIMKCITTKNPGTYKFSVDATGYKPLDPVIIIEPGVNNLLYVAAGAVLLAVAYAAFRSFRKTPMAARSIEK